MEVSIMRYSLGFKESAVRKVLESDGKSIHARAIRSLTQKNAP
jgi:hypothetical protein